MKLALLASTMTVVALVVLVTNVQSYDSLPKKESPGKCQLGGKFLECNFVKSGK
jgi:hypothetical protein